MIEGETDRQRQRERQTDRHRQRQKERQTDRQIETERQTDRQTETEGDTDRQTDRQTDRETMFLPGSLHPCLLVYVSNNTVFCLLYLVSAITVSLFSNLRVWSCGLSLLAA